MRRRKRRDRVRVEEKKPTSVHFVPFPSIIQTNDLPCLERTTDLFPLHLDEWQGEGGGGRVERKGGRE